MIGGGGGVGGAKRNKHDHGTEQQQLTLRRVEVHSSKHARYLCNSQVQTSIEPIAISSKVSCGMACA